MKNKQTNIMHMTGIIWSTIKACNLEPLNHGNFDFYQSAIITLTPLSPLLFMTNEDVIRYTWWFILNCHNIVCPI